MPMRRGRRAGRPPQFSGRSRTEPTAGPCRPLQPTDYQPMMIIIELPPAHEQTIAGRPNDSKTSL